MHFDRFDGAEAEHRTQSERDIGGVEVLHHRRRKAVRKPLPARLDGGGKAHPAALDELRIGFAEAGRRRHRAVVPARRLAVADVVERRKLALRELGRSLEHGVDRVGGRLREPVRARKLGDAHDMVENQALVADGAGEAHPLILAVGSPPL